jgi:hypothetical protein
MLALSGSASMRFFDLDVLKLTAPNVDGSDAPFGGKTKRQMSLELEDL